MTGAGASGSGLFGAEGEDLVDAAAASGWEPQSRPRAGEDVDPSADEVSTLGSGTRATGATPSAGRSRAGG